MPIDTIFPWIVFENRPGFIKTVDSLFRRRKVLPNRRSALHALAKALGTRSDSYALTIAAYFGLNSVGPYPLFVNPLDRSLRDSVVGPKSTEDSRAAVKKAIADSQAGSYGQLAVVWGVSPWMARLAWFVLDFKAADERIPLAEVPGYVQTPLDKLLDGECPDPCKVLAFYSDGGWTLEELAAYHHWPTKTMIYWLRASGLSARYAFDGVPASGPNATPGKIVRTERHAEWVRELNAAGSIVEYARVKGISRQAAYARAVTVGWLEALRANIPPSQLAW